MTELQSRSKAILGKETPISPSEIKFKIEILNSQKKISKEFKYRSKSKTKEKETEMREKKADK